jgi:two-component system sensor histidine kinase/response regulator
MRLPPALVTPGPNGLLSGIRSWWKARSNAVWHTSDVLPGETGWPGAHCFGAVRVLVVDDNPVHLMGISTLMASRGLVPLLAADGAEAVALTSELPFDLILMDLQMPILDGLRATAEIRRCEIQQARPAVPVVAYSSTSPSAALLATHGFTAALAKPCSDRALEDCLVRWCPAYRSAPAVPDLARGDHGGEFKPPG